MREGQGCGAVMIRKLALRAQTVRNASPSDSVACLDFRPGFIPQSRTSLERTYEISGASVPGPWPWFPTRFFFQNISIIILPNVAFFAIVNNIIKFEQKIVV